MTYLRRTLKYFIQISVLMALILGVLMLTGMVSKNVDAAFQHGWKSIGYIAALFAVMAAAYPRFGYTRRTVSAPGDPSDHRAGILNTMTARGYRLESEEEGGTMAFVLASPVNRMARLWEDRITLSPILGGFQAEGLTRDLVRVVSSLEYQFRAS